MHVKLEGYSKKKYLKNIPRIIILRQHELRRRAFLLEMLRLLAHITGELWVKTDCSVLKGVPYMLSVCFSWDLIMSIT